MGLKYSYTLFADFLIAGANEANEALRAENLKPLQQLKDNDVLLMGIGSGLDIPHLPTGHRYTGVGLTPSMLDQARNRANGRTDIELHEGDVMALPYADDSFDIVVMHLILAVVPHPQRAVCEAARVLRPGGRILILDKFMRPSTWPKVRRTLNIFNQHLATRKNVFFEEILSGCPRLTLKSDTPALAGGWFRRLELTKQDQ
jgi:phosphatidylethanolamine/phosphatidyl-N-methylethanolamine N-methyltransferase